MFVTNLQTVTRVLNTCRQCSCSGVLVDKITVRKLAKKCTQRMEVACSYEFYFSGVHPVALYCHTHK
jgi:hypothetical protein